MVAHFIAEQEEQYIGLLLAERDPEVKKHALQRLCQLLQRGGRLRQPHSIRQMSHGLLQNSSMKVRRWTLNALALMGKSSESVQAVLNALKRDRGSPEIIAAGVAALFGICNADEVNRLLLSELIPIEGALLIASAQYSTAHRQILAERRIKIDHASAAELRHVLILIGVGKAPENIFDNSYTNKDMIGTLNLHDDPIVAQYSVWAIAENPILGINDLRLRLKDIEAYPANVRAWLYRLITSNGITASAHADYITAGSQDSEAEVREGLAHGLKNAFFDGLEESVFDWYPGEPYEPVRQRLLEHMAAYSDRCESYRTPVESAYRDAPRNSLVRARLEVATQGTSFYANLRRIALTSEQESLFGFVQRTGSYPVTMVTQNISGTNVSIGSVTGEGDTKATTIQAINKSDVGNNHILEQVRDLIGKYVSSLETKAEADKLVAEAQNAPNHSTFSRLMSWLRNLNEGSVAAAGVGQAADIIEEWLPQMPN